MGAELAQTRAELAQDAESMMLDACTIGRPGKPVTDPDTGIVTTPETLVYGTPAAPAPCKVQTWDPVESTREVGEAVKTVQRYAVHIPVASYAPKTGDIVTLTRAAIDPNLVGRRYRVTKLLHKTMATAYRLGVEEAT